MPGDSDVAHPIEGQIVLLAGAKASVTIERLSALLDRVQRDLVDGRESYDRRYERIDDETAAYYLVEADHWESVGAEIGLNDREIDAVRRAHAEQFRRFGRREDRSEEFETSLEIRDVVAIG